jgi:hypothetical protein
MVKLKSLIKGFPEEDFNFASNYSASLDGGMKIILEKRDSRSLFGKQF